MSGLLLDIVRAFGSSEFKNGLIKVFEDLVGWKFFQINNFSVVSLYKEEMALLLFLFPIS